MHAYGQGRRVGEGLGAQRDGEHVCAYALRWCGFLSVFPHRLCTVIYGDAMREGKKERRREIFGGCFWKGDDPGGVALLRVS